VSEWPDVQKMLCQCSQWQQLRILNSLHILLAHGGSCNVEVFHNIIKILSNIFCLNWSNPRKIFGADTLAWPTMSNIGGRSVDPTSPPRLPIYNVVLLFAGNDDNSFLYYMADLSADNSRVQMRNVWLTSCYSSLVYSPTQNSFPGPQCVIERF